MNREFYKKRQALRDLDRLLEFCRMQLQTNLTADAMTYYRSRKTALTEARQIVSLMQDD